jgi:hypothetical protein
LDGGHSASYAVYGDSTSRGPSDVTVRGFVIQNFRTPLQRGAIQDYNGPGWIIRSNHITQNAAAGVATGDKVQVFRNLIDHNGQWLHNKYCVASVIHPVDGYAGGWFTWMNRNLSWTAWQGYGLDMGGTFKVGGTCKPAWNDGC